MDVGLAVGKFMADYVPKFQAGRVPVEQWYKDAQFTLDALAAATTASADAAELKRATDAWTELSVLLKQLAQLDDDVHFPGFVEQACTVWWEMVTERQVALGPHPAQAYRAMAAYVLAQLAFRQRDRGASLRWATLGFLADRGAGHKGGGGNEVTLRFGLSVPEETLALLRSLADAASGLVGVGALPEWLLPDALNDPRGAALVAPSLLYSHHPSGTFMRVAHDFVFDKAATAHQKGERLERLGAFLVSTVPAMRPRRRLVAPGASAEHDIVATLFGDTQYPLPLRATEWLLECKNTKDPMPAEQVGFFLAKMQRAGAKFGVIVAKTNVTGGDGGALQLAYADRFRSEFCLREDLVCLVLDHDDIFGLGAGGTFRGLIDRKYEESRFGK